MKRDHKGNGVISCTDFNKKRSSRSDRNAKVMRFQNFPNFAENFTQVLGYCSLLGCKLWRRKKVFQTKKNFRRIFWGEIFLFF